MTNAPSTSDLYKVVNNLRPYRQILTIANSLDAGNTVLLILTLLIWRIDAYNMSLIDLGLYILHITHLLAAPALVVLLFNTINFYYINLVAILYSFCAVGDIIAFIWRAVRLSHMADGATGRWLETTVMVLALTGAIISTITTVFVILFARGLRINYNQYTVLLANSMNSALPTSAVVVSFRQSLSLFKTRTRLRSVIAIDFFLYVVSIILRCLFYYGVGLWFMPYLQLPHLFLFLWIVELAGSDETKLSINSGGSDASMSRLFALIVFIVSVLLGLVDGTVVVTTLVELLGVLGQQTILETIIGSLVFVLSLLLIVYDIWVIQATSQLASELRRFASLKIIRKNQ